MNLIVVVSQFRAGGSALASSLNSLGVPFGTSFLAPVPPRMRFEFEDIELSKLLLRYMPIWKPVSLDTQTGIRLTRDLVAYFGERARVHHAQADAVGTEFAALGVKSCLMAPAIDLIVDAAKTARLNPYVVHVLRAQEEIDASMRTCLLPFVGKQGHHWTDRQAAIRDAMSAGTPDATVWYRSGMIEFDPRTIVSNASQRRASWERQ